MFKKRHPSVGARPGTLLIPHDAPRPRVRLIQYSLDVVHEVQISDFSQIANSLSDDSVSWIDVQGLGDESMVREISEMFGIHPLAMEDVVNIPQRPKAEQYDDQLLIVCRAVELQPCLSLMHEQISLIVGPNYVISFQERYTDMLEPVRRRVHRAGSRLRSSGTDYLAYAILDVVVDAYYPALESLAERLEQLEELIIEHPEPRLLGQLNRIRNSLTHLRRAAWPKREVVKSLIDGDHPLIGDHVRPYLRDTYDHVTQVSEAVEMCRETVSGLTSAYISSVGQRTNEIMRVLTIMSSVFVPLTFLAGIYGMNFEIMPELRMKWAYPLVWLTMLLSACGMLSFFWRKGWIGKRKNDPFAPIQQPGQQSTGHTEVQLLNPVFVSDETFELDKPEFETPRQVAVRQAS